ncbi:MAG: wax ester/triacylglycerol synthase family O-acyltransferase [Mycobacteriaceae bacterium]
MERLSGLDASFLYLESPTQLLHVCGLLVLDPATVPGGYTFDKLKHELYLRTRAIPAFRRKLHDSVFNMDHPVWIDDDHFDIDRHLHRTAVPAPGEREQLAEACAHIAGQPQDRERPLWEFWVIEGLADGKIAVMTKMHHASVDGVSGANLMSALCGIEPDAPRPEPDPKYQRLRAPSDLRLAADGLTHIVMRPVEMVKLLPGTVAIAGDWIMRARRGAAMRPPFTAPRTSFNGTITGHRSIAYTGVDLAEVKEIKNAFGTTVNDVVLALCAGALRGYLQARGELPDSSLLAMVPVSVREGSETNSRNAVSGQFATLPTDLADPVERLESIAAVNSVAKEHHKTISAAILQDWAQFAAPTTFGLAVRAYSGLGLAEHHPVVHNLVISNVPGPPVPMYFLGAEVLGLYPLGPVFHGAGLNITVLSNNGHLDIGIIACLEQVPNPWMLADEMPVAVAELLAVARQRTETKAPAAKTSAVKTSAVKTSAAKTASRKSAAAKTAPSKSAHASHNRGARSK